MRIALIVLCATLAPIAPAGAQQADFAGTWAFQSKDYGDQQYSAAMSGVAIMTPAAPGRYDIRLLANELIAERATGRSQLITAQETCVGQADGPQFVIDCQLAEPIEGYEADNFLLQAGQAGQLEGVLNAASGGQVRFTRVR